jgi:heme exporter protein A
MTARGERTTLARDVGDALDFDAVTARGLVKVYGPTRALAGVDVTLAAGRITAIEGPNGSGKSTLLALLALLARPTRGTIRFGTHDAEHAGPALRARIGVLAHAAMVYPDLTGRENLRLFADLYGLADREARIGAVLERFEIGAFVDRPARTYSRGQLQRVALARALVHAPRLLLLDEPSTGLDAPSTERLARAIDAERARGTIVALVTHDAPLAERLADVRVRLERGRVVSTQGPAARSETPGEAGA